MTITEDLALVLIMTMMSKDQGQEQSNFVKGSLAANSRLTRTSCRRSVQCAMQYHKIFNNIYTYIKNPEIYL